MIPSVIQHSYQIRRWFTLLLLLCVCAAGFERTAYTQANEGSHLIEKLMDPNWQVRNEAAKRLGVIKDARAVEPLIAALKDGSIRGSAAGALEVIKDARAVERLLIGLRESDMAVITGAFRFFVRRGEPGSENVLSHAMIVWGNRDMAVVFLNSGNYHVEKAAREWAQSNRYQVRSTPGGSPIRWGSR